MTRRRLTIDFAPRTFWRAARLARWHHGLLMLAGLVLAGLAAHTAWATLQQVGELDSELAVTRGRLARRLARQSAPPAAQDPARVEAANGVIDLLNLPWRPLLKALEQATPPQVALLSLVPDAAGRRTHGTAEAASHQAMLAYLQKLNQQPGLGMARLTRHGSQSESPDKPIRFEFDVQWQDPAP
jgi:hypothetical protein